MKTLHQELEETARNEIFNANYQGDLSIEEFYETPRFKASTDMVNNDINEKYNPEYEEKNPKKSKPIIRDITRHEINHHKYKNCFGVPQTLKKHVENFYEPMLEILSQKGFSPEDTKYTTNTLQDTLLHKDLNENQNFALDGISDFFEEVGNSTDENEQGKKKFTKFYEAHVKLNMYLWGNKQQKRLLQKFCTHDEKVNEVMKSFLERCKVTEDKEILNVYTKSREKRSKKGKVLKRVEREDKEIEIKNREKIQNYFLDENNWKEISKIYAEEFSKLMEPNYAMPIFNHSGKGTKGREAEVETDSEGNPQDSGEGNVFDKKMRTKNFKKARVKKSYTTGTEAPSWINNYEAMDLLYESLAQKLEIKAKTYTEEEQMPVAWYGKREFNPEKDNLKHTTFGFNENGEFELRKKRFHEDIPIEIKIKPESFPRMRFGLLDTSDSMGDDVYGGNNVGSTKIIPWGDKSKYHYALLGWYGFLEYLKSNHLLKQNSVDLANFSKETILGKGLADAKRIALNPQFHETNLDKDKINYFFEGRNNLILAYCDGDIHNWSSIKDDFIKNAQKHYTCWFQIGKETQTTQDLRNANIHIEPVMGDEDLARKTIDLTDKIFRRESK